MHYMRGVQISKSFYIRNKGLSSHSLSVDTSHLLITYELDLSTINGIEH